jgi:nucleoside-diphosphate-sugar epimerase
MRIAVTGGTGFIGRYILHQLIRSGNRLRCWYRQSSDRSELECLSDHIEWVEGDLDDREAAKDLVVGCDAVVHAALYRVSDRFQGGEGDIVEFAEQNIIGTLRLIEAARKLSVGRFLFVSTCAVHDKILSDRKLDETHPVWPASHYGAYKGAIEAFVHSYGDGHGYPICALRPTGVYGLAHPAAKSKWYGLVQQVVAGKDVTCNSGGKEVHAADVAKAVELLLKAPANQITGEAYNCSNMYISDWDVAQLAKELAGSASTIHGWRTSPKNQIATDKIRLLGMQFGGDALLRATVGELVAAVRNQSLEASK